MAPAIVDHQAYCDAMQGSLQHKLFFTQHIPKLYAIMDYGCADGKVLDQLSEQQNTNGDYHTNWAIYYDADEEMLKRITPDFFKSIYSDEDKALAELQLLTGAKGNPTGILFSSVLHELYSQRGEKQMREHWEKIAATGVDYIILRDMYWGEQGDAKVSDYPKMYCQWIDWLSKGGQHKQLNEYNEMLACGESTEYAKYMTEFLLKLPYQCNWQRELQEDYFALPDLRPVLSELGYEVVVYDHHSVDFIKNRIKADTGIELKLRTHLKAIFKRR